MFACSTCFWATKRPCFQGLLSSGGRIRTCDLRVMSPTSYQTAPPRGGLIVIADVKRSGPDAGQLPWHAPHDVPGRQRPTAASSSLLADRAPVRGAAAEAATKQALSAARTDVGLAAGRDEAACGNAALADRAARGGSELNSQTVELLL
jgi:hypothetical protein